MSVAPLPVVARWRPADLVLLADSWDALATRVHRLCALHTGDGWRGAAADAAHRGATAIAEDGDALARVLVLAAVAARDGAGQLDAARTHLLATVATARAEGFNVDDDGRVRPGPAAGDPADGTRVGRAAALAAMIADARERLDAADRDTLADLAEAFAALGDRPAPALAGTAGVAWDVRAAANRTLIAQAIVEGTTDGTSGPGDLAARTRTGFYRSLLAEVDDPAGSGRRVDRTILAFDPARETLIELNGDLRTATSLAVLVPGMNTTVEGSADETATARAFVTAGHGAVAMITFLGGPFPHGTTILGSLREAASARQARSMAPGLAAFSHDVTREVDAAGHPVAVTYVGHSYGGAILGTAESLGLTADRVCYVAAAGAGVDDPSDWHDGNPDVRRFSLTAPGDPIALVQGLPGGPHGADPDELPGVVRLPTGRYADGRPMVGPSAHTDVLRAQGSDAWRNVLGVITGDPAVLGAA